LRNRFCGDFRVDTDMKISSSDRKILRPQNPTLSNGNLEWYKAQAEKQRNVSLQSTNEVQKWVYSMQFLSPQGHAFVLLGLLVRLSVLSNHA